MKVGIVYHLRHPGGVQTCALALIKGLNRRGIVPDLLWDSPPDWDLLKDAGLQASYRRIPFPFPTVWIPRLPYALRRLGWMANKIDSTPFCHEYDFFYIFYNGFLTGNDSPHLRYLSGPPLLPQLEAARPGLRGLPARGVQGLYDHWLSRSRPVFEYHRHSRYVINSEYTARLFEEAYGVRLPVVYPPMQVPAQSFREDDLAERDTLTFFSRINPKKRPEMVLELARRHPEMRCLIMGAVSPNRQAYLESLRSRSLEMNLTNVVFAANLPIEKVREELKRTRFYVFPAEGEHFGITTVETIACGAVPYVHDSGGQREIVPDPRLRFGEEDFLAGFEVLLRLPAEELNRMRGALYTHVQNFSEEVFISKMLAYLPSARD